MLVALDGDVEEGMQVLVHAAAGGVGAFAVWHCKSRRPTVHATASARNAEFVGSLGADTVIDYETADFRDAVSDLDVVYDAVGGDVHLRRKARSNPAARWSAPPRFRQPPAGGHSRFDAAGRVRTRGHERIAAPIEEGAARLRVDETLAPDRAFEAHRLSETGHAHGRSGETRPAPDALAQDSAVARTNSAGSSRRSRVG